MALAVIQEQNLSDIADAIRSKNGTSDTYKPSQMAQAISDIPTGGGQDSGGKYLVQVIDYDGTVLKQDHLNSGATFTMPDQPSHSRLVFQEWSSYETITGTTITVGNRDIIIGAIYTTASGMNEYDILLNKATGLTVSFSASGTKDWGDGITNSSNSHTYSDYGSYTIKTSGVYIAGNYGYGWLIRAFLATPTMISYQMFNSCGALEAVSLPRGITTSQSSNMSYCKSLKSITYPSTMTGIVAGSSLRSCYTLGKVVFPKNISQLESMCFENCYQLTGTMRVPPSIQSIGSYVFNNCSFRMYDFSEFTNVVPLDNTNAFQGISGQCKIIVPDALYDTWIAATNWVTYANYIYKASEV